MPLAIGSRTCYFKYMTSAEKPANELERLFALRSYGLLDTACETNFDSVAKLAAKLTGASASMITLVDSERQWFKARFACDLIETPRDHAMCAHAILEPHEALVVPDTHQDLRFADNPLVLNEPKIRFYAGQPLVNPEGMALGTLCVIDPEPRDLTEDQRHTLKVLADSLMTTLEFRRLARIDSLTGLANRAAFLIELDQAVDRLTRMTRPFALLYLDLDGFKQVNDCDGHDAGDRLLRDIAATLIPVLDEDDIAARIGGDEFAILSRHGASTSELAARIHGAIADAMQARGWMVTASIGAATIRAAPADGTAALKLADAMLYEAKVAGRDRVVHRCFG